MNSRNNITSSLPQQKVSQQQKKPVPPPPQYQQQQQYMPQQQQQQQQLQQQLYQQQQQFQQTPLSPNFQVPPQQMNMNAYQQQQKNYSNRTPNSYSNNNNNFGYNNNVNHPFGNNMYGNMSNASFQANNNPEMRNEESIKESVKNEKTKKNITYDLQKGLSLEVKTLQKHFQFNKSRDQVLPIMVSVKTLDSTSDMEIENSLLDGRPSLDLVCVIDNSGSMGGTKIANVQQTIIQLIDMLNENDRLSLITFNSNANMLCNLRKVSNKNKEELKRIARSIAAGGGTNITSGMQTAFEILKGRNQSNPVSSVFLLSDGQDNSSDQRIRQLLSTNYKQLNEDSFTIHSFGFGDDHDGPLMQKIAQIKDGSFYYIQKIDQVDEFFIDALGGLFSVVAQDINLKVQLNKNDELYRKFFSNAKVSRTYGQMWKVEKQNESYIIKINQLFSGVSKDFIFEITIPKADLKDLQDFERNVEIIQTSLTAIPINNEYTTQVLKDANLVLTLFTENEKVAQDSEINDNVEFNYLRVKAAEAMEDAMKFADKNQYAQGQEILTEMMKNIDNSHPKNRERLQVIKQDIVQCQQSAQPQVYQQQGRFNMLQNCNNNYNQQSYANRSNDIYQNKRQQVMVQQQQVMKNNRN